jgi:capsule polysaccharide export protein KpsE/RkpR
MSKKFAINRVFNIGIEIDAKNIKEAKAFANDYFKDLVSVDTDELNGVVVSEITPIKRPKVVEINEDILSE